MEWIDPTAKIVGVFAAILAVINTIMILQDRRRLLRVEVLHNRETLEWRILNPTSRPVHVRATRIMCRKPDQESWFDIKQEASKELSKANATSPYRVVDPYRELGPVDE